jgi:adenylate cyclase
MDSSDHTIRELVHSLNVETRKIVNADRSSLWVLDSKKHEMWTVLPDGYDSLFEVRIEVGKGFVGLVAETREPLNIPFDLYDSTIGYNAAIVEAVKETDRKTGYRTCSILCVPTFNSNNEVIGVIQLINKLKEGQFSSDSSFSWHQVPDQFKASFDARDQQQIIEFSAEVGRILQDALG